MNRKPIANNWDEMTFDIWLEEQEILMDQETDAVDKNVRLVALMYDMSEEDAYNEELNSFSNLLDGIGWLGKNPDIPEVAPAYNINGRTYIVNLNPQKVTTAQYIDFKGIDINQPSNIPDALSVIMVPSGHTYNDGYDMEQVKKDIYECLRIPHALAITRFFFQQYKRLTLNSLQSLSQMLKKEARRTKDREKRNKIKIQIEKTEEMIRMFGSL